MTKTQPIYTQLPHQPAAKPQDEGDQKSYNIRIDADILIPGRGKPIKNGSLVYTSFDAASTSSATRGKITYAGPTSSLPTDYAILTASSKVPILMPGLWDCHVHFFGEAQPSLEHIALLPPSLAGTRSARDVVATLNAGFTSVREVGGYGIDFSAAIDEGWIPGPKIYSAGAPLNHGLSLVVVDGVDEAIKAVRKQIRRGAKSIKICSTGGVMSRIDSPRAAQFTSPELKAMVEEATRTNMVVASHAHGTEGILAALHAGVKTIEHGSFLTKEAIDLMLEKKAMLVATRFIQQNGVDHPENMPPDSYKKLLEVVDSNRKSYEMALKEGRRRSPTSGRAKNLCAGPISLVTLAVYPCHRTSIAQLMEPLMNCRGIDSGHSMRPRATDPPRVLPTSSRRQPAQTKANDLSYILLLPSPTVLHGCSLQLQTATMPGNIINLTPAEIAKWPPPNYDNPDRRRWMPAYAGALYGAATIMAALRIWLRFRKQAGGLGVDDKAFLICSWLCVTWFTVLGLMNAEVYMADRHVWDIPLHYFTPMARTTWIAELAFLLTGCFIKVSVLLFYRRLVEKTCSLWWVRCVLAAIGFTVAYTLAFVLALIFKWVQPQSMQPRYTCLRLFISLLAGIVAVISDLIAVALPCIMMRNLKIPRAQKFALNGIFSLGLLVVAASGVRTYHLWECGRTADFSSEIFNVTVWSLLELNLGLMCASAPALRVVFREYISEPLSKLKRSILPNRNGGDSDVEQVIIHRIDSPTEALRRDFPGKLTPTCSFSSGGVTAVNTNISEFQEETVTPHKAWDERQDSVQANSPHVKTPADYEHYNLQNMEKYRQSAQRHASRGLSIGEEHEMSDMTGRSWL
ncbi:integral membrane [Lecanosticta acicola]|uniref:Integral membrane n=1 Tax=Lecanosticta acicola TaxID=111012 RepID=A0AAI8Z9C5_9PEZI|nr:integral membrane [Lecanosticta acicola]